MSLSVCNTINGGVKSKEATATAGDVLRGMTYLGSDTRDIVGTGTLALSGNAEVGDVLSGKTFYTTDAKSRQTGTLAFSGNAAVGDVLSGKTFYNTNAKSKQTGTLALSGNAAAGDVLSGKTFYNTNAQSKQTGSLSLSGNAIAGNVEYGKTFYSSDAKTKLTGTMTFADAVIKTGTVPRIMTPGEGDAAYVDAGTVIYVIEKTGKSKLVITNGAGATVGLTKVMNNLWKTSALAYGEYYIDCNIDGAGAYWYQSPNKFV